MLVLVLQPILLPPLCLHEIKEVKLYEPCKLECIKNELFPSWQCIEKHLRVGSVQNHAVFTFHPNEKMHHQMLDTSCCISHNKRPDFTEEKYSLIL